MYSVLAFIFLKNKRILTITGLGRFFLNSTKISHRFAKFVILNFYSFGLIKLDRIIFLNTHDYLLFSSIFPHLASKFERIHGEGSKFELLTTNNVNISVKNFLFASRIMEEKGILELLDAFKLVPEGFDLYVLGSIDSNVIDNILIQDMITNKLKNVHYLGFVENITSYLQRADCVVLPSKYMEGLPIILVEALSQGKLIITSNSPGCSDTVINGKNGLVLNEVTCSSIFNAVISIGQLDIAEGSQISLNLFESKFSSNPVNRNLLAIYNSLYN
jgi:glycosyltransferase involved in cell wall biosynthesis